MESTIKLGEIQTEVTGDVKTIEDLKVLLRWGWGAETTGKLAFKPSEELKVGDGLRIVVEKVITVPDPVEEKVEETSETAVENPEVGAEKSGEAVEETETIAETPAETSAETTAETVTDTKSV
jgi:hypothetical protein